MAAEFFIGRSEGVHFDTRFSLAALMGTGEDASLTFGFRLQLAIFPSPTAREILHARGTPLKREIDADDRTQ